MLRVESDAGPGFVASASKAAEYDGLVQRLDVCSAQSGPAQHPDALGLTSVSFQPSSIQFNKHLHKETFLFGVARILV